MQKLVDYVLYVYCFILHHFLFKKKFCMITITGKLKEVSYRQKKLNLQKNFIVFLSLWKIESCLDNWRGVGVASAAMAADGYIKGTQE
jgi:hypothetical protein